MRLYLVLLPLLLLGQSKLWSWQIKEQMTREEIKVELLQKQQELEALLTTNNIAVSSLEDSQQAVLKEAYGVLGLTFIGKKTFIERVQIWVNGFKASLSRVGEDTTLLNMKDLKQSLYPKIVSGELPISSLLWNSINSALSSLGKEASVMEIRKAFASAFDNFYATISNNKFELTKHYKENKVAYKTITEERLEEQIMSAQEFEQWLLSFSNTAEKKADIETEKAEQAEKEFNIAYGEWLEDQKTKLSNVVSDDRGTDSINNMSKAKFVAILLDEDKDWQKIQPELSVELREEILSNLKGDSLDIGDCVNAMLGALTGIRTSKQIIKAHWYKSRIFPTLTGIITTLTTKNDGNGNYDIIEEYIQWFAQVGGVVDSLKLSNNRQFVAGKLVQGFSNTMGSPELQVFLPELTGQVTTYNKKYLSVKETAQLWKTAVGDLIRNSDSLVASYERMQKNGAGLDSLDQLLLGQAGVDSLQAMFKGALRPLPKLAALANGEAIELALTLNDGTILTSRIKTKIDREKQTPFALASGLELLTTKGSSAYHFKETALLSQSPVFNSKDQVTVDFEYSIQFSKERGSSEKGGGVGIDSGRTNSTEDSDTNSTGVNTIEGTAVGVNGSSTTGITGKTDFSLFGLFEAGAEVSEEVTVGGHKEWISETETEVIKSTTKTVGTSTSTNVSSNASWNATVEHGQDSGYFTIKGSLVSSEIDTKGGTMLLSIELVDLKSPNMKGFAITKSTPEQNKTVRWKK